MAKGLALALFMSGLMMANPGYTCDIHGRTGIVEENDLWIPADQKTNVSGMDEETFDAVLDRIEDIYTPIVRSLGKTLRVDRNWENGTVNAFAQQTGNIWRISMFGGLARHETVTPDGFALVACHEMGHHLAGIPRKRGFFGASWASNEGQSDYFGNAKCIRIYFEEDDNISIVEQMDVPDYVTTRCMNNFTTAEDVAICQRGAMAGLSLANLFHALRDLPDPLQFETPDPNVVARTNDNHPAPQCRLDTYFQGALCEVSAYVDFSTTDFLEGACNEETGHVDGIRPRCWFAP